VYGKVFKSIYDGSLYGQWEAIVTMQQLIVLADADGIIDMTPPAIAGKTSIPLEILEKGLKILSEPDPYSRSPGSDGARIQLLDEQRPWGWFLVNHIKYRDMRTADDRKKYMKKYMRNYRKGESVNNSVNSCKQSLAQLANAKAKICKRYIPHYQIPQKQRPLVLIQSRNASNPLRNLRKTFARFNAENSVSSETPNVAARNAASHTRISFSVISYF